MAWMFCYRANLRKASTRRRNRMVQERKKPEIEPNNVDERIFAEREIVRHVQGTNFHEELSNLRKSVAKGAESQARISFVKKSGLINKLDPKLEDDLLCVGGRLRNAPIPTKTKHPLILPKNYRISILIARHYRLISGHSGLEHVLSFIREKFWIVGARATLRRILDRCISCKRR